ncbi:hypothetical protein D3C78_1249840 [compost metagenome]
MSISPKAQLWFLAQIFISDVNPTNKTNLAIHDNDFAMIAKVEPSFENRCTRRQEAAGLYTSGMKRSKIGIAQMKTAYSIINNAYFYTSSRFACKYIQKPHTYSIITNCIVVQMDMMLRPL